MKPLPPHLINKDNPGDNVFQGTDCPNEYVGGPKPGDPEDVVFGFIPGPTHVAVLPSDDIELGGRKLPVMLYCDMCDYYDMSDGMRVHHKHSHGGAGKPITHEAFKALRDTAKRPEKKRS